MSQNSGTADSLLAGKGFNPSYGLNDSKEDVRDEGNNQWFLVSLSALTACIASMVAGMSLSFSSIVIEELSDDKKRGTYMYVDDNGIQASMIGVSPQ